MTDPTSHTSPSERDDDREDASRDSYPPETNEPVSAVDLDVIEQWARGSTIVAARARIPDLVRELRASREIISATVTAVTEALGLTAPVDVIALQLDQHVANLAARLKRVTAERDALEKRADTLETRDPNPTVPGSPGERRMRRG